MMVSAMSHDMEDKYYSKYLLLTFGWNVCCILGVLAPLTTVFWNMIASTINVGYITYSQTLILYGLYISHNLIGTIILIDPKPLTVENLEVYKEYCNEEVIMC